MSDLIDRQEAIELLLKWADGYSYIETPTEAAVEAFKKLPSAEPEIIHCRDCKYASPNGEYGCKAYHFKLYEKHEMQADDFCSRAERRTDE